MVDLSRELGLAADVGEVTKEAEASDVCSGARESGIGECKARSVQSRHLFGRELRNFINGKASF